MIDIARGKKLMKELHKIERKLADIRKRFDWETFILTISMLNKRKKEIEEELYNLLGV